MNTTTFSELINGIAGLLGIPAPGPAARSMQLVVDDMPVSLLDNATVQPGGLVFVCDFGAAPYGPLRNQVMHELLHSNLYMISTGAPTFCLGADGDRVLFSGRLEIAHTSVHRLLDGLGEFASQARTWRQRCQDGDGAQPQRGQQARRHGLQQAAFAIREA